MVRRSSPLDPCFIDIFFDSLELFSGVDIRRLAIAPGRVSAAATVF